MGDIGPEQQRYEVLPVNQPVAPVRREPAVETTPAQPSRTAAQAPR